MNIDIRDYLSKDEIKEICLEEIRKSIHRHLTESETTRIIGNASYYCVHDIIDNTISVEQQLQIVNKVDELLNDISAYDVFRTHWQTGKPESLASKIIENTVKNNEGKIIENTNAIISRDMSEIKYEELINMMMDNMYNGFDVSFRRPKED